MRYESELYHHGILGQKWGVRRYQNYDGTYTKAGLERYNKAKSKYDEATENVKSARSAYKKGDGSKATYRTAVANKDIARKDMNKAYEKLENDYNADKGKELYSKGKTITGNTKVSQIRNTAVAVTGFAATRAAMSKFGMGSTKTVAASVIAAGADVASMLLDAKTESNDKKLRAYYSH